MQQYTDKEIEEMALAAIADYELLSIVDLAAILPISRATFYNKGINKLDSIKKAFEKNRLSIKSKLRRQWADSEASATVQIALYKLAANEDELQRLTSSRHELTGKDGKDLVEKPDLSKLSDDELEQLEKLTKKTKR